jgi:sulfonate transport system ATP-binding protein
MNGISLKNVCKDYKLRGKTISVLKDINLELALDSKNVLIGKSGCGKTTLLKLISGLVIPSSGSIDLDGAKLSYVFQSPNLFPWKNVRENIEFPLKKAADKELIDKWISLVKLDGFEGAYPSQLSGGMQFRVSIARAMVADNNFILLDEPFSDLDGFTREKMQELLLEIINYSKKGFLFVTHSIEEAVKLADNLYIMDQGKIVEKIDLRERKVKAAEIKRKYFM